MLYEAVIDSVSLVMELLIHGRNLVTSLTDKKILKEVQIINYVGYCKTLANLEPNKYGILKS